MMVKGMGPTAILAVLASLAAPATASARGGPVFPAGNSSVNQYVEVVPTVTGGRPVTNIHSATGVGGGSGASDRPSGGGASPIAPSTQRSLSRQGTNGAETAAFVRATAPAGVDRAQTTGATSISSPAAPQRSVSSEVLAAISGSATHGGLGPLLPALLIAALLAAPAFYIARRRNRRP
jgi:hypothetical protein